MEERKLQEITKKYVSRRGLTRRVHPVSGLQGNEHRHVQESGVQDFHDGVRELHEQALGRCDQVCGKREQQCLINYSYIQIRGHSIIKKTGMKRSFDDYYNCSVGIGDVMAETTFKYINARDLSQSNPLVSIRNQAGYSERCQPIDLEMFLSIEESALLEAAHQIETQQKPEQEEPQEKVPRDIRRVKRPAHRTCAQTIHHQQNQNHQIQETPEVDDWEADDKEVDITNLSSVELEDKSLEKLEVEYLEKVVQDAKLPITPVKAQIMKKYTDLLLNRIVNEKSKETTKVRAENIVLKRAFQIQNRLLEQTKQNKNSLISLNDSLSRNLSQAMHDNSLMANKLREYQMQKESSGSNSSALMNVRRDIEGF